MTEQEAIQIVKGQRRVLEISPEMKIVSGEKAIVQYKPNPDETGVPEDHLAWIVTLSCAWGFIKVYVDDEAGTVLKVKRSA